MVNGDVILNIHPDNITDAWESWTRDHDVSRSKVAVKLICIADTGRLEELSSHCAAMALVLGGKGAA